MNGLQAGEQRRWFRALTILFQMKILSTMDTLTAPQSTQPLLSLSTH
jgi:hypothetical protein